MPGLKNLTITNPDGQFITVNSIINITSASPFDARALAVDAEFAASRTAAGALGVDAAASILVTFSGARHLVATAD